MSSSQTKDPLDQYIKLIGIIDQARLPGESSIDCLNRIIVGDGYNINIPGLDSKILRGELQAMKGWLWMAIRPIEGKPGTMMDPIREALILAYKLGAEGILPTEEILQRWLTLVNP